MKFNEIDFTPAEIEILKLIQQGLTVDDIAKQKVVGKVSVSGHLYNIYRKSEGVITYRSAFRKFNTLRNYITDPDFEGFAEEVKEAVQTDLEEVREEEKRIFTLYEPIEKLRLQYNKQIEEWKNLINQTKIKLEALKELEEVQ